MENTELPRKWREENGIIYFSVTSDGTTGKGWIKRLKDKVSFIIPNAIDLLCSGEFKPTVGITFEVAVLKGMLFEDNDRVTEKIRTEASNCKLETPNVEIACLIRDKFTDEEIGAMHLQYIVTMHEPIFDRDNLPSLFVSAFGHYHCGIDAFYDKPNERWYPDCGFAFVNSR